MRLLVTRPEPDAGITADILRARGHTVLVQSVLDISFADPPAFTDIPGAIAVTSQNALRALARWPQVRSWLMCPLFPAGPATARAAEAMGFQDVRAGAHNAESLASVIAAGFPSNSGYLLYPAARDRAGSLDRDLAAKGYEIRLVEAYRADPVAALEPAVSQAFSAREIDGVLVYSRRTAEALVSLANRAGLRESLANPVWFVISRHVAEALAPVAPRLEIAAHPNEDSLLALIPRGA